MTEAKHDSKTRPPSAEWLDYMAAADESTRVFRRTNDGVQQYDVTVEEVDQ